LAHTYSFSSYLSIILLLRITQQRPFAIIVPGDCDLGVCVLRVSTVCIQIAIEKDWVISISEGIEGRLTTFNVSLRRVDLLCSLISPLLISYVLTRSVLQNTRQRTRCDHCRFMHIRNLLDRHSL
jgi:hypothetical protein